MPHPFPEDRRHSLPFNPSSSPRQISMSYQPPMVPFPRPYFTSMSMPDLTLAEIAANSLFSGMEASPPSSSPPLSPEVYSPEAVHFPDSSALSWPQLQTRGPPSSSSGVINPFDLDLRRRHHSDNDILSSMMYPRQASRQQTSPVGLSRPSLSPNPARTSYYTLVHPNQSRSSPAPSQSSPAWRNLNEPFDFSPSPSPLVGGPSISGADQEVMLSPVIKDESFSPEHVTLGMFPDDIQYGHPQNDQSYYTANAPSPPEFFLPSSPRLNSHVPSQPPSLENSPAHALEELPSGDEPIQVITRKSRGRQVPNVFQLYGGFAEAAAYIANGGSKDPNARTAICFIPGCGACFVRNEHLKRHLISIHSQDKPWYCPYPKCGKNFNRRDNLVQHVHTAHVDHGHGTIPIPQNPYNCPFPDVVQEVYTDRKAPKSKKPKMARKGPSKYD